LFTNTETEEVAMSEAQIGTTVKIHYTGKLDDGSVFDSSQNREPIQFKIGEGDVIKGLEEAVIGMKEGDSKTVTIATDDAYGPYREELVTNVDKEKIPDEIELKVGQLLKVKKSNGNVYNVTVSKVGDSEVTLDANHPLAGRDLTFDLELVEVHL
jgi:FKBP-type peptidyl-prolyl cis-trans isomerase 2